MNEILQKYMFFVQNLFGMSSLEVRDTHTIQYTIHAEGRVEANYKCTEAMSYKDVNSNYNAAQ